MTDSIAVKRYGDAFVASAKDSIGIRRAVEELGRFKEFLDAGPEFLKFMESLEITQAEKNDLIEKVFAREFSDDTRNFIRLLLKKSRINKVADIAEYISVAYSEEGIFGLSLRSAFVLDQETVGAIQKRLEEKFHKKFKVTAKVDKRLLGGVQAIIGNTVIDGTVRRRLDELKEKLAAVKI